MDVSIVIVNWNTRDIVRNCLCSTYGQTKNVDFEVIVIDNASMDGSAKMVQTEFPQVNLIKNSNNVGFAAACNQGIAISKGKYVLLLNSDIVILDNAIAKAFTFAETHPEAAVVGCRVLNPDKTVQQTCFMFPSLLNMLLSTTHLHKLFSSSGFFGREYMTWWDRDDVRQVDCVTGCFMLVRQNAIKDVGTLDERFFMYGEETDWCYRFKKAGWVTLFTPGAEIVHLDCASSKQIADKMFLQLRGSISFFFKKHKTFPEYIMCCILTSLFFALRAPVWGIVTLISNNRRKDAWNKCLVYVKGALYSLAGYKALCARKM
jgi:GT2 family glycosyltransferase